MINFQIIPIQVQSITTSCYVFSKNDHGIIVSDVIMGKKNGVAPLASLYGIVSDYNDDSIKRKSFILVCEILKALVGKNKQNK